MTRAEMLAQREQQFKRERQAAKKTPALPSGPPSIYTMPLPIPGAPGKEVVTQPTGLVIGAGTSQAPTLKERVAPAVITPDRPSSPPPLRASSTSSPMPRLPNTASAPIDVDDDEDEEDQEDEDSS
jgi:hypothetical protein